MSPLLEGLVGPADLRRLPDAVLPALATEIRALLIDSVPRTSGHLGPNLGVVELTIGLHRVFDSPTDAIIWDTGHQAYVHKLRTGRREGFARLRSAGGLRAIPAARRASTTWWRTRTPRPRCPMPTVWRAPSRCAASGIARWSRWSATVR